ncbi:MAG TPA: dihydroorotate dehydrogenase electron transfer subunit [Bacteroidota bacterium]|nr:dihydroorotate dehydrogenase electron transfer subunit [Bacteroidota bacterium]
MIQEQARISSVREIAPNIFQLSFFSPVISLAALPGQFVNVKPEGSAAPLLRRPFSIFSIEEGMVSIIFNVVGIGTRLLSEKKTGETLDVLGPLGKGTFPFTDDDYETAVLVAGGLGVAALPFLTSRLRGFKQIMTFLGARSSQSIVRLGLDNIQIATDDGSEGFHGTVVDVVKQCVDAQTIRRPRIFACGPTPMMRSLAAYANGINVPCYLALECEMACGIGLCQGCPVETTTEEKKYRLVCKDGPVFDSREIVF